MAKLPSEEELDALDASLQPYFIALGKVAHAWNHLHEELGKVFCSITGLDLSVGMNIWHSIKSDRSQREMLAGAITAVASDEDWVAVRPQAVVGVRWLLKKIDKIASKRNSAIHAPCFPTLGPDHFEIKPLTFFSNRLALRLAGKDILKEFSLYEEAADTLRQHTKVVRYAIDAKTAWPDRPPLPDFGPDDLPGTAK